MKPVTPEKLAQYDLGQSYDRFDRQMMGICQALNGLGIAHPDVLQAARYVMLAGDDQASIQYLEILRRGGSNTAAETFAASLPQLNLLKQTHPQLFTTNP